MPVPTTPLKPGVKVQITMMLKKTTRLTLEHEHELEQVIVAGFKALGYIIPSEAKIEIDYGGYEGCHFRSVEITWEDISEGSPDPSETASEAARKSILSGTR